MNIAYVIALKGRPFTDFKDHIKLHEVKLYTNSWKQNTIHPPVKRPLSLKSVTHILQWWNLDSYALPKRIQNMYLSQAEKNGCLRALVLSFRI